MDKSELALIITAQAEQAISTLNRLNTQLNSMSKSLTALKSTTGTSLNGVNAGFNSFGKTVDGTSAKVSILGTRLDKLFKLMFSLYALRKVASFLFASYEQAVNYTETLNLFNTAIGSNLQDASKPYQDFIDKGRAFQEEMRATFGTNMQEMMNYQGMFTAISKSLGLTEKSAYMVGKSLNSLSLDLSSLYNRDIKTVNEALKSGLVGQTKPVRSLGMDITERTLNNELKSMGIRDRSVAQMSQTEKVILRYNTMLKQSAVAHGDFAKTIETPANQLRIFKNQLSEIKMWLGNVFYGTMAKILPFINGFAMALKEVIKTIALFFGFKENIFGGAQYDLSDAYGTDNLSSGLDDSVKNAKKLNKEIMGFDEINNISVPDSSTSGGGGVGTGIDPRLLNAMKEYENTMDGVRMKAIDIRDKIMEWLGFTKYTDLYTGETMFKYKGILATLKNMAESFWDLSTAGKIFVSLGIALFIANIVRQVKKLLNVLGASGLVKILKSIITPLGQIISNIKYFNQFNTGLNSSLKTSVQEWTKTATSIDKCKLALSGIIMSVSGLLLITNAFKSISENGLNFSNVLTLIVGALALVAGAISVVTAVAGTMTVSLAVATAGISLLIGAVAGIIAYFAVAKTKTQEYSDKLKELNTQAKDSFEITDGQITRLNQLTDELNTLVSSTGEVQKTDEKRVNYILTKVNQAYGTEYELIKGKIVLNGKEIKSNNDLMNNIEELMKKKRAESILNAYQDVYNEALREQNTLMQESMKVQDNSKLSDTEKKKRIKELKEQYDKNSVTIKNYEKLEQEYTYGTIDGITKATKKFYDDSKVSYDEAFTFVSKSAKIASKEVEALIGNKKITIKIDANTKDAVKRLNDFGKSLNKSGLGIKFYPLSVDGFAEGGFPTEGQMFFARESGPEMVGNIGNRTAVVNNDQIVQAVSQGVASAVSRVMGTMNNGNQTFELYIDGEKMTNTVIKKINSKTQQFGNSPLRG